MVYSLHQSTPYNLVITMKVIIIMTTYFRHNYFEVILNKEYQDDKYWGYLEIHKEANAMEARCC